ncbi:hypothetical protein EBT31_00030 [bacterium]|nr:hypothetical protein [bacterium]
MIQRLIRALLGRRIPAAAHADAEIQGLFRVELRERGKLVGVRDGKNVCTLTGREYITRRIGLASTSPRTYFRNDCISYLGVGVGSQPEVSNISALVDPVAYASGLFLAQLDVPTFPAGSGNTGIQFARTFGYGEISLGMSVNVTEAGLFTDGDPEEDWSIESVDRSMAAAGRAPAFYKAFDPLVKNTDRTMQITWEVRVA